MTSSMLVSTATTQSTSGLIGVAGAGLDVPHVCGAPTHEGALVALLVGGAVLGGAVLGGILCLLELRHPEIAWLICSS